MGGLTPAQNGPDQFLPEEKHAVHPDRHGANPLVVPVANPFLVVGSRNGEKVCVRRD